jgi:hypothetical protein
MNRITLLSQFLLFRHFFDVLAISFFEESQSSSSIVAVVGILDLVSEVAEDQKAKPAHEDITFHENLLGAKVEISHT